MRRTLGIIGATALASLGVLAFAGSAQAETIVGCKTVTVADRSSADSGENGNDWATTTITRKLEVCATAKPETGDWRYKATVTDTGTFVTRAGESPGKALVTLKGGFTGKVVGGFEATFDAPKWADDFKLTAPTKSTPTSDWVKTAFGGTPKFDSKGSVANWGWTYTNTTCSGEGQKWVNAEAGSSGDITEKACSKPPVVIPPKPEPKKCEAYVYYGSTVTLCDRFANHTGKLNCSEVKYKVKLVNANNDPWGLDGSGGNIGVKGVGCEAYPIRVFNTPSPTPSPTHSTTPPVASGPSLPVTGAKAGTIAAVGGAAVVIGAIAAVVARRRKTKFAA